jgi:hypothetical protein
MILLVSGASKFPRDEAVGHLIVPRQWNLPTSMDLSCVWAMDNGCFIGFDAGAYMRMLYAFRGVPGCQFVTAPDAVGDAAETRSLWPFWSKVIRSLGHTPAFVAQDGLSPEQVPWDEGIALFIGGSTQFKERNAQSLIGIAKAKGVWAHVGRVNGKRRYEMMLKAGADSIDGSGFSICPEKIHKVEGWRQQIAEQPELIS